MEDPKSSSHKHATLPGTHTTLQGQQFQTLSEFPCSPESRPDHILSPRPRLAGQFSSLLHDAPHPPPVDPNSEILGSTALRTPSVESAPGPSTTLYGPIGKGRGDPRKTPQACSNHPKLDAESGVRDGNTSKAYIYQSHVQSPETTSVSDDKDNGQTSLPHQPPSSKGTCDETLLKLGMLSLASSGPVPSKRSHASAPRFRPAPRHSRIPPLPHLPPFPDTTLANCLGRLLDHLDGTFRTQHQVCDQVIRLGIAFGLSAAIPIVIGCVLEYGVTHGYPRNTYVAGFCRCLLPMVSQGWVGPNSLDLTKHYQGLVCSTFMAIFSTWWTPVRSDFSQSSIVHTPTSVSISLPKSIQCLTYS